MTDTPRYLENDRLDEITRMLTELASEVWILRDRTLVLEHLLRERGCLDADALDALRPSGELLAALGEERAAFVGRVFGAAFDADTRVAAAARTASTT
ncbi:hypothetical protein BJF79_36600 [Actinomadura sp. CNU-125]|uniref:hypothetical protein n=1 Tax=Actinomadura sp. CNU-125 TaxID=1904961 RepID=UPI000968C562|nr:hypothetical protein [Actinomadura sp. CNU-125]OLT31992.1 hypothetical protein BJF79_36600 [Actinomadura sp. CNU-125]